MSIKKKVRKTCLLTLGCTPEPDQWNTWDQLMQLSEVFGERKVHEVFDEWAETKKGDVFKKGPVTEFLKIAPGLCTGVIQLKPKGDLFALLNELAVVSNNRVIFNREQQAAIGRLLTEHSPKDIVSAFGEYYGNIETDEFSVRNAARTFVDAAEQLLYVRAKRAEDARRTADMVARCTENERVKAAEEARKMLEDEVKTRDLEEDTLPEG